MVVKNQLKLIKSLHQKKYRNENRLFFVEGIKSVTELLASDHTVYGIYATTSNLRFFDDVVSVQEISKMDLKKISALKNPSGVFGVFQVPEQRAIETNDWILALDAVQDPGNLGTIIRLCDWYGIKDLVCSTDTVDCYNPKVLQASMGSIARVNVHYRELTSFLGATKLLVYGAFMGGDSVYGAHFQEPGILVMGNEANGISQTVEKMIGNKISIPQYGQRTAESLNVAMATGILLNEIRRG